MECPALLAFEETPCAGGTCVNSTFCNCSADFMSGRNDFVFGSPSCFVNGSIVQSIWICVAVINMLMLLHMAACIITSKNSTKVQKSMVHQTTLLYVAGSVQAVYRSANPLDTVGILHPTPTVLFLVYNITLLWPMMFYIDTVLSTSIKSVPASQLDMAKIQRVRLFVKIFKVCIPTALFSLMIMAIVSSDPVANTILSTGVFIIYLGCGALICGIMIPYVTTIIISITSRSIKEMNQLKASNEHMIELARKFKLVRATSLGLFLFMAVIFVFLGFLPIAQRLYSYTIAGLSICSAGYFMILLEALNVGLGRWRASVIKKLRVPATSSSVVNNVVVVNNSLHA